MAVVYPVPVLATGSLSLEAKNGHGLAPVLANISLYVQLSQPNRKTDTKKRTLQKHAFGKR